MNIMMMGLGRMGGNMVQRLAEGGHDLVVYDVDPAPGIALAEQYANVQAATDLSAMLQAMPAPRCVWMMVPHPLVDRCIQDLLDAGLSASDVLVDGGNSCYRDSQSRAASLGQRNIEFVDCGTSGGVWGMQNGYSLMIGGSDRAIARLTPAFKTLAPAEDEGWGHVGPAGAGHFTKMIHNGIEYGMMQAMAEGLELLQAKPGMDLDLAQITRIWKKGSVVSSWLLDLTADALAQQGDLSSLSDWMDDSGEGRWTVQEGIDLGIPTPVMTLALQMRFRSRQDPSFAGKVVNAMRAGFGGHPIKPAGGTDS